MPSACVKKGMNVAILAVCCMQTAFALTLTGTVQSGGSESVVPIEHAQVEVYKSGLKRPAFLGRVVTDHAGHFKVRLDDHGARRDGIFYAVASQNKQIQLLTVIGERIPKHITLNEMTTVGAAYAMAQFLHDKKITGNALGLRIASSMNQNLISPISGDLSKVIKASPNADETNSMRSISSLSNLLAACVQEVSGACRALFKATDASDTLEAALHIAHDPAHHVATLFELAESLPVYEPRLTTRPDAWTLAVKFNDTGSKSCPFGGPAKLVFDEKGFVWINNNVVQGTPDSAHCMPVLKFNGEPANGHHNTPHSPIDGGGLWGPGFGLTIDTHGDIWVGGFGWGKCTDCVPKAGVVSQFSPTGKPISGSDGYIASVERAQGLVSDKANNIWIASAANDRVVVFPHGDPNAAFYYQEPNRSGPFDIAIGEDGVVWVSNSTSSIVSRYMLAGSTIVHLSDTPVGKSLKQISLDSAGHAWVASLRDSSIYELDASGGVIGTYTGVGGISHPWGVSVDGDQNIWVANFQSLISKPTRFSVSKLCGHDLTHCPQGLKKGDPISPETGYTLPTAGSPVLLHDGTPLYGKNGLPSFNPLMRLVQVGFDQAGNAWMANNWKPSALVDLTSNPGGDGVVVFVGLAGIK